MICQGRKLERCRRWLTDVTPLRSLLKGEECTFTAQTAPWALPWKPSLRYRFSQHGQEGRACLLAANQGRRESALTISSGLNPFHLFGSYLSAVYSVSCS